MPQQCSLAFFPELSFASVSPRSKVSLPPQLRMSFAGFQKDREEEAMPGRARSCRINVAFAILRTLIPTEPADRKLSKIETLRLACSYISHLGALLISGSCDKAHQYNESSRKRAQVCTFCLASTKKNHLKHGP